MTILDVFEFSRFHGSFCIVILIAIILIIISKPNLTPYHSVPYKNLVLVTSVIHTVPQPLSYGQRSVFSHEERYEQTIKTIASVRKHTPNAHIVLVEGSTLTQDEHTGYLTAGCDLVMEAPASVKVHVNGPYKSVGEIQLLLWALSRFHLSSFKTITKISGRYIILDTFQWDKYPLDLCLAREGNTFYYRIPIGYAPTFKSTLTGALNDPRINNGELSVETYGIFRDIPLVNQENLMIGVQGVFAPFGTLGKV